MSMNRSSGLLPALSSRRRASEFPALRKWGAVFAVYLQDSLAYRSQAVIWILADTVPAIMMPMLWLSSAGGAGVAGYSRTGLVVYYLAMLCLTHLMVTHIMWDIAMEIREGRFAIYLTRPMSYMAFQYAGNLSWRLLRGALFLPVAALYVALFWRHLRWEGYELGWSFWAAVVGGHVLSFLIGYALGLLALFFTEVRGLYLFYYLPMSFLSGEVVPLAMLPEWARRLAEWLPFRYTLAFPIEIFMNRLAPAEVAAGFAILGSWLAAAWIGVGLLWRAGLRAHTGFGM